MWQNIIVIAIVAGTAALVDWQFYKKLTGKSSCCGGCSGKDSCGSGASNESLRPLNGSGCGCGR
jgi:hypothetical protein